jgi:hypothetical protein
MGAPKTSIPLSIEDLKELLRFLGRRGAPPCDHTLREAVEFLKARKLDTSKVVPWLRQNGGFCDCEVIFNVYDKVGDIVGWCLDKNA